MHHTEVGTYVTLTVKMGDYIYKASSAIGASRLYYIRSLREGVESYYVSHDIERLTFLLKEKKVGA